MSGTNMRRATTVIEVDLKEGLILRSSCEILINTKDENVKVPMHFSVLFVSCFY